MTQRGIAALVTMHSINSSSSRGPVGWNRPCRTIVFLLAAMSIWCLLAEMYGLCSMRTFTLFILVPATLGLYGLAIADRQRGEGLLWRGVVIGTIAGLIA